ncbi:hypothetical protein HAX54_040894, partial [Datura stramonium]|nr:hypothetical protein [Datura stramonium]
EEIYQVSGLDYFAKDERLDESLGGIMSRYWSCRDWEFWNSGKGIGQPALQGFFSDTDEVDTSTIFAIEEKIAQLSCQLVAITKREKLRDKQLVATTERESMRD